jgi:hypothetical protein
MEQTVLHGMNDRMILAGAMEWKLMWTKKCNGNFEATILSTNFDR